MKDACDSCGYGLDREPGFYLGSIYVNYGLTALLLVAICGPIVLLTDTSYTLITPLALLFCVAFPTWFHRYARSIWLGFDFRWDGFRTAKASQRESSRANREEQHQNENASSPDASNNESNSDSSEPEGNSAPCPFCHHRQSFDAVRTGKWIECDRCGNRMLARMASRTAIPNDENEASGDSDPNA